MSGIKKARASRLQIADPGALARELESAIDARFDGNDSTAATAVGLKQSHLSRILAGKFRGLTPKTVPMLLELVSTDEARERVLFALLSPTAALLLSYYVRWCEARISGHYPSGTRSVVGSSRHRGVDVPRTIIAERKRLALWRLFLEIDKDPRFRGRFKRLEEAFWKAGRDEGRLKVAYWRILEPLFETHEAGLVECRWDELREDGDKDLLKFVEAGVTRECLLLRRTGVPERAQEVARLLETRALPGGLTLPKLKKKSR
jgi:hypothetical protein